MRSAPLKQYKEAAATNNSQEEQQERNGNQENVISNSSNQSNFDNDLHFSRLILPTNCKRIPDNWLNLEILELMTYRADPKFKLLGKKGKQLCICSFARQYESSMKLSRFTKISENTFSGEIFGPGIEEIATLSKDSHKNKQNLKQFDKKDENDTLSTSTASGAISAAFSMSTLQDDNNGTQFNTQQSSYTPNPRQQHFGVRMDTASRSFLENYVAFDLEWKESDTGDRSIYAAAFVDNHGNRKVFHISDFANSEPDLLRAITNEILKYPASIGWYTTGVAKKMSSNHKGTGGVSAAA